ncbi:MAG: hypothetical protein WA611_11740, partial [Candidatus Acidiferrales bacterium]
MKSLVSLAVIILVLAVTPSRAQTVTVGQKSPVDVVRDFMKIETSGGRLTAEGWREASVFFIRPNFCPYPRNNAIHIILNYKANYAELTARTDKWTEVYAGMNQVGVLDSALRFTPSPEPPGVEVLVAPSIRFDLVLTDKHWQLDLNDGGMSRVIVGPPEWKIVNESPELCITIDAAVRYVTEARAKTKDPLIRKNADSTLAVLKRMQHPIIKDPLS